MQRMQQAAVDISVKEFNKPAPDYQGEWWIGDLRLDHVGGGSFSDVYKFESLDVFGACPREVRH